MPRLPSGLSSFGCLLSFCFSHLRTRWCLPNPTMSFHERVSPLFSHGCMQMLDWCKRFHAQLGFIFMQYLCHVCREKQYPARKYCPNENWWEFWGKTFPAWSHTWSNRQQKLIYIIRSNEENKIVTLMVYWLSFLCTILVI